jgi:RNA polymerase sigma-70 factor, ECF subfamily
MWRLVGLEAKALMTAEVARIEPDKDSEPRLTMIEEFPRRARDPEQLVELFSDDIWRFASSQLNRREDAEDVVMEVFGVALRDFHKVSRASDQRLWLLAIARRKVVNVLRLKYRRPEASFDEARTVEQSPMEGGDVKSAVHELSPDHAEALVLKYVNGLSTEEVSKVMRKSLPATNSLLQRARNALRTALGPSYFETGATK